MIVFDITQLADNGIIRESSFRNSIAHHDWSQYDGEQVMVKGCGSIPIPTWAYLIVASHLAHHASEILFGEAAHPTPIFKHP